MSADLADMLKISHGVGRDPRLVQGGGGNTSVKTGDGSKMYIKASGTALGEMAEGRGYRLVDVPACVGILEDEEIKALERTPREAAVLQRLVDACLDDLPGRPSVETSLHAILDRCVVHTHPSVINGLLCATDGPKALEAPVRRMDPPYLYIEFCGAGYSLGVRMYDELKAYRQKHGRLPEAIFLGNHGLFVTAKDADSALQITSDIFDAVEKHVAALAGDTTLRVLRRLTEPQRRQAVMDAAAAARRFYRASSGGCPSSEFSRDEVVDNFIKSPVVKSLVEVPPLTPDQVVYCNDSPVWVPLPKDLGQVTQAVEQALAAREAGDVTPVCVVVDGLGLFCAAPTAKLLDAVSATMKAAMETLYVAAHHGEARGLDPEWIPWIRDWEVERFRSALARGAEGGDDLAGKAALVTGAGSGLGRGIALCLARKGCNVILADVDTVAAAETAGLMASEGASGRGFPLEADVTDEESVAGMVFEAVSELGGVDVLVNCAGIAPAFPLTEFPLAAWRQTLEVNLTGYFLVGREVARCMVRQGTGGSIVNISSKSGLEPSKSNSAYNATKAGQIHLARGWALDLAEHGIRVNVVCPGNVFQGSKIWNEDYIKTVAEKRGIEPEDVIPYYVGLTALKQEITADDIGEAVAFLASNRAAKMTGQTLVVDGGQVFVR